METNRLRQFKVIAETGNLRKAGEILGISHAGLSKSLRQLEEDLQIELVLREGRGIRVSRAGEKLLRQMAACLDAEDVLRKAARGLTESVSEQRIRIGTFEVFSTYLAPTLLAELGDSTRVDFQELIPGELEKALLQDQIDAGITYLPIPTRGIEAIEIKRLSMGIFTVRNAGIRKLQFEELPFVVPSAQVDGAPTRVRGLDGWPDDRILRKVQYQVSLMESAMSLTRQGFAAAYLPRFIVDLHNQTQKSTFNLEELPFRELPSGQQPIYALRRSEQLEDRPFRQICRVLRKI